MKKISHNPFVFFLPFFIRYVMIVVVGHKDIMEGDEGRSMLKTCCMVFIHRQRKYTCGPARDIRWLNVIKQSFYVLKVKKLAGNMASALYGAV